MANIKINPQQWESLSQENKNEITEILRENGLLKERGNIISDPNAQSLELANLQTFGVCETLCDIGYAATVEACKRLPDGPVEDACKVAAQVAYNECKNACD